MPWRDVDRFVVMPTLFGRIVQVARRGGKRVTLAAPRDGLLGRDPHFDTALETMCALAAPHLPKAPAVDRLPTRGTRGVWIGLVAFVTVLAVVLWHPWVEPWWPGRHEATKLPRACALLNTDTARRLAPYGAPGIDTYDDFRLSITSRCRLYTHTGTRLGMELDLKNRSTFRSGTDEAREDFERTTRTPLGDDAVQVGGLGDAAWRTVTNGGGSASVQLTVRRRNVIVEVDYDAPRPATQVIADAETVARETLRRIFG